MSLLDRFRNSRQKSVLPDEVKQYYQSETRQRRGVAIGLAIVALLVTIAVAAALFFGGRFAYNKITGDDTEQKPSSAQNEEDKGFGDIDNKPQDTAPTANQGQSPTPAAPPTPAPAPAPAPAPPAQSNPTTPALGDSPLPRTGDEGM